MDSRVLYNKNKKIKKKNLFVVVQEISAVIC